MFQVKLENLKGIKELVFPFPERKGLYVLTGINGCGKTSLLIALSRLGDKYAFKNFQVKNDKWLKIDAYKNASIIYKTDTKEVKYQYSRSRWAPTPRENSSLINAFPFINTLFISTLGLRFYTQDQFVFKRPVLLEVSDSIKRPMKEILSSDKYDDLKFITVKGKKGRQSQLHRNNKLYVIQTGHNIYSEHNFSLGERLLLNTLDTLEHITPKTLLLIDEVELALHPLAQIKFYDYLKEQALQKDLAIIISTHSASLINHAEKRLFLEKQSNGTVEVLKDCFPSYILRTVSSNEEQKPDFFFFVEDDMATDYFQYIVNKFLADTGKPINCKVIPVGPYESVVKLVETFPMFGYNKSHVQAFLDEDVKTTYREWHNNRNRTEAEQKKYELFNRNGNNISYLSITPELGVWEWIEQNSAKLKKYLDVQYGLQTYDVVRIIEETSAEEAMNKGDNLRNWAKGCFKNIADKINAKNHLISKREIYKSLLICYANAHYDLNRLKRIFFPLFNRDRV